MALIVCPLCVREDDVFLLRTLPDGRKEARCDDCDFVFTYGSPVEAPKPAPVRTRSARPSRVVAPRVEPVASVQRRFPTPAAVAPEVRERVDALKQDFLPAALATSPIVASHWAKFRWVFSEAGLDKAVLTDLHQFVTDQIGANVGDTTAFDKAWVLLGELEAARRVRASAAHLLRGYGPLEDRLTTLADGTFAQSMPGAGESVWSKVLAVAEPDRFLPVVTYAEKRDLAGSVYGLELPPVDDSAMTIGRLAVWSNDLLVDLAGDGFDDLHQVVAFLREASER